MNIKYSQKILFWTPSQTLIGEKKYDYIMITQFYVQCFKIVVFFQQQKLTPPQKKKNLGGVCLFLFDTKIGGGGA